MKIAIHRTDEQWSFCNHWINYCKENAIPFKTVNAYDSDIIEQVSDCDAFMWHFSNYENSDSLFAKQLLYSIGQKGLKVFPDFSTCWHFDDKVGQKYLLEAAEASAVPSYVFYSKKEAMDWIAKTTFPKVFKLRGGSGSSNVKLIRSKKEAFSHTKKAFGQGFSQFDRWTHLKYRFLNWRSGKESFLAVLKGTARLLIGTEYSRNHHKEKGYVYYQDFIPNNESDIRVIVIGNRAFAIKRLVRKGDFRASGSGSIIYTKAEIDENCISMAFDVNSKINSQCTAFDFVFNLENDPLVVEISYGFASFGKENCEGYWDNRMNWYEGGFNPYGWMIENLIFEK